MRISDGSSDVCASDLREGSMGGGTVFAVIGGAIVIIAFISFMERAQRRVLVQYPKRATQRGVMQADRSHLPLKVNTAGVIPPIFASSLLLMPLTVTQMLGNKNGRAASRERVCQYVAVTEVAVSLKKQNT